MDRSADTNGVIPFGYSLDSPLRDLDSQGRSHLLARQLASGSSLSGVISYGPFGGVNAVNVTASTAVTAKNVSRCKVYLACETSRAGPAVTGLAPLSELSVTRRVRVRVAAFWSSHHDRARREACTTPLGTSSSSARMEATARTRGSCSRRSSERLAAVYRGCPVRPGPEGGVIS